MEDNKQLYTIILRHDTSTQWAVNNPILALGEYAVEDDTHRVKRGDGETEWNDLLYEEFGLVYLVTYKNLSGDVSDSPALQKALDEKMSIDVFKDVQHQVVSSINIEAENGAIGKITRITKDISSGSTDSEMLLIKSSDNSVQGYWSIDRDGLQILNLEAESTISDYEAGHMYYQDQLCYYKNVLYRALGNFEASENFNEKRWVKLASLHSSDIKFDNLKSGLEAENVKDAIDELQELDSEKLKKTKYENKVYGTDKLGNQFLYNKDDLRTVDSVNGVKAQNQETKNIQIDADDINYDDDNVEAGTIKKVLDDKVDKTFAGEGKKIVRDIKFNYNSETGHIELVEDKVSPEDGTTGTDTTEIDVVSEKELTDTVNHINETIVNVANDLNETIDNTKNEINTRIDKEVETLNDRVSDEVNSLTDTIVSIANELTDKYDGEVSRLDKKIDDTKTELNEKIDNNKAELDEKIDNNKTELDTKIDTTKTDLDTKFTQMHNELSNAVIEMVNDTNSNVDRVESEAKTRDTALDTKIDTTKSLLEAEIGTEVATLNERITNEKSELNEKINTTKEDLTNTINDNKADIEKKLNDGLDTKIDKDIADNIVTGISVSTHDKQPTIRIVSKNTRSKQEIYDYVHFGTNGKIKITMADEDHLVVDSTVIDDDIADINTHLTTVDNRLDTIDSDIASLNEHDVNHDRDIASNSAQIALHETRIHALEDRANGFDTSIADLDSAIKNETTTRQVEDAKLATDIARNVVDINNNRAAIATNAQTIKDLDEVLSEEIRGLSTDKLDKEFAKEINNKIVGNIDLVEPKNNEVITLNNTMIDVTDNSLSTKAIKIISSDNTVVAKAVKDEDGNVTAIDIATNLDTDVNYFITSETLNSTIAETTVVPFSSLTKTDKEKVELQDIISDSEGTWARVQSIDEENATCTAITFHKHAQAVWGTVKGNIETQADLMTKFDEKIDKSISDKLVTLVGMAQIDYSMPNVKYTYPRFTQYRVNLLTGENTQEEIGSILPDDDNSINMRLDGKKYKLTVKSENLAFDKQDSNLTSTTIPSAIRELSSKSDEIKSALDEEIATRGVETEALKNDKVDKVSEANKVYGTDETGAQTSYDKDSFGKVDTVNGKEADTDKNVTLTGDDINVMHPKLGIEQSITDTTNSIYEYLDCITSLINNQYREYIPEQVYNLSDSIYGDFNTPMFVTFTTDDNILLIAKILKYFVASNIKPTVYENFQADVEAGNLILVGIPEQVNDNSAIEQEAQETMVILNSVDGVEDTYDGLGGTQEEVEAILDEVLGTNN